MKDGDSIMKRTVVAVVLTLSALSLGACGESPGDRALSGGAIGAASGAAIGAAFGNPIAGAVVGGVAGAATGVMTRPDQVDLGRPAWQN
jgi:osmotically inducible lipoprotein OsmB